jgi:hypothetical protein
MSANTYYWRAVRRLAKKHGVSITKARRMDWEKEAERERKRRSKAQTKLRKAKRTKTPPKILRATVPSTKPHPGRKRIQKTPRTTIPTRVPKSKLKLRDYERIPTRRRGRTDEDELFDESDFEGDEDFQDEWETDWERDFPELDSLDDLEDFLEDFEYEDSDKYKEPS